MLKELEQFQIAELMNEEKQKIEKRMMRGEALNEAILASIGEGLIVTNVEGTVGFVNQAFSKITGWEAHEVIGKNIDEVLPAEDFEGNVLKFSEKVLRKILRGEEIVTDPNKPVYNLRKDKTRFSISAIITPILFEESVIGMVKTFRDTTKERNIDLVKTEFVSLASHQLRTPLSSINWYTEMLLAGDVGELTDEQKKYLNEVYKASKRMVGLVKSLLDVSRMDMGTFVINAEEVDLKTLVESVADEQKPLIDKKNINLKIKYEKDLPDLNIDPKHLRMVVQNLLSNSLKYTPQSGRVDILLELDEERKKLILSVGDTGYGIPKEEQGKIFTKLFRAKNVQEVDTEGTGLGLYIVKTLVENSGGKVRFESVLGKGTTFFVTLPL